MPIDGVARPRPGRRGVRCAVLFVAGAMAIVAAALTATAVISGERVVARWAPRRELEMVGDSGIGTARVIGGAFRVVGWVSKESGWSVVPAPPAMRSAGKVRPRLVSLGVRVERGAQSAGRRMGECGRVVAAEGPVVAGSQAVGCGIGDQRGGQ